MMGSNYVNKSRNGGFRGRSGSSIGSDKEINAKLRRAKIRRPAKMNEFGAKRIPDYTELAYKEAVGKLRYFLSGNYSPSVRSYGGSPSIKNLDDSDGDLDKKYSSYSALEKRRPRLTTKYATLYADSLHNYNTSVPPPAPADATSTNPDVVNFIQKQEEYIEQLERESQYCRDELNNLLGKVKEVITENEHLHEAQKDKLINKMFHSYTAGSETDELDDVGDSTGLDSDHRISTKPRKTKSRPVKLEGPNIVFESRIAELEAQLTQAKIDLKKIQEENNENKRKIASGLVDSTCLDGFKRQIDNLQRDKTSLESQIAKLKLNLEQKDDDGRYKRGSDVIEQQLREERNNLELEIRRLKDDLAKERSKVRDLCGEGARRAIQERSAAEQRYNTHCDELSRDLAAQCDNVARLQLELERQRRDENDLKRELSMKNAAIEELKMEIKNKTSGLQADLAQAYAEKASLEEELASARLAIERHQRQAKHEANRLNSEIQSLRQRLDRADADLVHSRRENLRLSDQIASLEKELNMKTLTPTSPQKSKKEKEMSSMIENIENKHARTVGELESMIHSQNSLMEKLTGECRLLTDKLDDANRRHKAERAQLHYRNIELMRKLRSLWCSHKKYCTPFVPRAFTPISGYANSRSSYDLDRTGYGIYLDREEVKGYGIGRYYSDLSLDKLGDSDEDSIKCVHVFHPRGVCVFFREELATLQRQVETLGRSLQPASTTDTYYQQAPATHASPAHRNDDTQPRPRYDDPGDDSADHAPAVQQPIPDLGGHGDNGSGQSRAVSRQQSRQSVKEPEPVTQVLQDQENVAEKPMEQTEHAEHQYEQTAEYQTEYDQSYPQAYPENTEYQNQNYEQQGYEQQPYEGQYDQSYQQYPQQYTDPNSQFQGQYENYNTDPIYQNVEGYSEQTPEGTNAEEDKTSDYNTANQEYSPQDDVTNPDDLKTESQNDLKRNNSPTQKQPVKS